MLLHWTEDVMMIAMLIDRTVQQHPIRLQICRRAQGLEGHAYLLKILRVSMMSLKDTKFSMRQCSLILLPVDVVSGSERCNGCPAALMPSGMLAAAT